MVIPDINKMLINFSVRKKGAEEMVESTDNPLPPVLARRQSLLPSVGSLFSFFSSKKEE